MASLKMTAQSDAVPQKVLGEFFPTRTSQVRVVRNELRMEGYVTPGPSKKHRGRSLLRTLG